MLGNQFLLILSLPLQLSLLHTRDGFLHIPFLQPHLQSMLSGRFDAPRLVTETYVHHILISHMRTTLVIIDDISVQSFP